MLNGRDFLNGLAFRTFFCSQYVRHHSLPRYTPEPDLIHDLLGHAPLFVNKEYVDFSQEIGLASLGVSDEEIQNLATNYLFSIEFGLIMNQQKERKIYGAGILSSADEIIYAMSNKPEIREWKPQEAIKYKCELDTFQPRYFYTSSLKETQKKLKVYAESIKRNFNVTYNIENETIEVDRNVKCFERL